jgi:hypothetical protein
VGDLTRQFAGKPKAGRSHFGPAMNRTFAGHGMECRIHFDGREMARIKLEPERLWQIKWIKGATPVVKAPRARADAYLLLIGQIQNEIATLASLLSLEKGSLLEIW